MLGLWVEKLKLHIYDNFLATVLQFFGPTNFCWLLFASSSVALACFELLAVPQLLAAFPLSHKDQKLSKTVLRSLHCSSQTLTNRLTEHPTKLLARAARWSYSKSPRQPVSRVQV